MNERSVVRLSIPNAIGNIKPEFVHQSGVTEERFMHDTSLTVHPAGPFMLTQRVIRIDHAWQTPSDTTYGNWISQAKAVGRTPAWILDLLRGRQVWVVYENGVMARYAHLSSVRPDLKVG